ncbi:ApaG domain [Akkermansiaceae bacterium]|nr:ApaG domain [Akkermansiaceae bacterium]
MSNGFSELSGLRVEVEKVIYTPHLDAPEERPHPFVYFISIINDSAQTVTIRGRKWVLQEDSGEIVVVEGQGVVGETPDIEPSGKFSYNSYHVIKTRAVVTGAFFGTLRGGKQVRVTIPEFILQVPKDVE